MSNFIIQWWKSRKLRFLVIGAINTAWGFGEFSLLYHLLHARVHALVIQAIATVIGVTFSYVTLKIFVFKTKGNYAREYISFYGVYAIPITTAFALFWLLVTILGMNAYLAQFLILAFNAIISYVGHSRISFAVPKAEEATSLSI